MNIPRLALVLCVLATLGACMPETQDDTIKKFNKSLGENGELTPTHLIIHWFGDKDGLGTKPVTLRIPREYLNKKPFGLDAKNRPQWINILFSLPDATPWHEIPQPGGQNDTKTNAAYMEHFFKRVYVELDGGTPTPEDGELASDDNYYRREAHNQQKYIREADVAGLERYVPVFCPDASWGNSPDARRFLQNKPADDPSPPGCFLDRRSGYFFSPMGTPAKDDINVVCDTQGGCTIYFVAALRRATLYMEIKKIKEWRSRVEPARRLINGFVVAQH